LINVETVSNNAPGGARSEALQDLEAFAVTREKVKLMRSTRGSVFHGLVFYGLVFHGLLGERGRKGT
jgi:hypothetical protein